MERVVRSVIEMARGSARRNWLAAILAVTTHLSFAADSLQYTKNYFVTGDYQVAGVGLRGKGGADGFATGTITMSGVPAGADIVAAFLYWQSEEPEPLPNLTKGFFNGKAIVGDVRGNANNAACWSSGGTTKGYGRVYRADVLRYLDIDPVTNTRIVNKSYTVRLKDSGGNGNGQVDYTNGATLVVVYRTLGLNAPLRSVVIYDGAYTVSKGSPAMSQDVAGFYEASSSPAARLTHVVGNGQPRFGSSINYPGGVGLNELTGGLQARFDNDTFNITLPAGAASFNTTATTNDNQACYTWAAIIASTNVNDTDGDGLLNSWETKGLHLNEGTSTQKATFGGCADYPAEPCVDLKAMGALPGTKDLFLEIDWLQSTDHVHIPKLAALNRIGARFEERGINVHFDVGNYGGYATGGSKYIIPSNLSGSVGGGESVDEALLSCPNAKTKVCAFPGRVALGWKIGFRAVKGGFPALGLLPHFAHNRKDIFHYVLFSHALAGPYDNLGRGLSADPWSVSGVADRPGGDLMVSLGLWRADNPSNCNPTVNCNDQTGSELVQAGTLMHELGHNLNLLHSGGTRTPNCEPNYQSTMNYLYQTRGLTDASGRGQIDFSTGSRPNLLESALNNFAPGTLTYRLRFFGPPNAEDITLDRTTKRYCTNGARAANQAMRLESGADMKTIDWSNGIANFTFSYDVNFDGTANPAFSDYNDWANLNLRQIGARTNVGGLSTDVGQEDLGQEDLGQEDLGQEDLGQEDLGQEDLGQEDLGQEDLGDTDSVDIDYDAVISTLDATDTANPLQASSSLMAITLTWGPPSIGQIRTYNIFRTADPNGVFGPNELSTPFATINGVPPATTFVDAVDGVKTLYNIQYTYFLQAIDINGTKSGSSNKVNGIVKHLFIAADNQKRLYGSVNPSFTFKVQGLDPGLTGTTVCTTTATQFSNVGPYPITCAGLTPIEGVTYTAGTLTINPAPLTITATANSKQYDGTVSAAAKATPSGLLGTDKLTDSVEEYLDRNAGTGKTLVVTSYTVADGNGGKNYEVTLAPNSGGVITAAPVTASITANDKVYDKTTAATVAGCTLTGVFPIDANTVGCTASGATFASANTGTWTVTASVVTLTGNGPGNYQLDASKLTTGTAKITPALVTASITVNDKVYDKTTAATVAGCTLTGVIPTDVNVVGCTASGATFASANAGTWTVTASVVTLTGNAAGNYTLDVSKPTTGTAKITPAPVTASITANDKVYDKTTAATVAGCTLTGVIDGDAAGCTAGGATFASANAGTWTVTASLVTLTGGAAGNYKLDISKPVVGTAKITKATPTMTINGGRYGYDGLPKPATGSVSGVGGEFLGTPTFTYTPGGAAAPVEVGAYTATGVFAETTNYFGVSGGPVSIKIDGFVTTGSMATARSFHTATLLPNGKVLIAGGSNASGGSLSNAEVYDPTTGTFSPANGGMPNKATGHTATLMNNGKVLIAGGGNSSTQVYDPVTNSFSSIGGMSEQRSFHTATLLANGKVLLAGGSGNNGSPTNTAQIYDPVAQNFTNAGNMTTAREYHTATLLSDGKVLIAGGRAKSGGSYLSLASAELYDPATNTFTAISPALTTGRFGHSAAIVASGVNSGKVLIVGGANAAALSSAELYDPATNTFSVTGPLSVARQFLTASPIVSGILVAGGSNSTGRVGTAQQYQGSAFVPSGIMKVARSSHTATVLNDGSVLIVGGQSATANAIVNAELYKVIP